MNTLFLAASATVIVAVLCEWMLWRLFARKMAPLTFSHKLDTSYFRFFSLARMRVVVILHTLVLILAILILFSYLW